MISQNMPMEGVQGGDGDLSSPESAFGGDLSAVGSGTLQEKLRALYVEREELDIDIKALERALDILKDPFS